jgi:hypothetical protein
MCEGGTLVHFSSVLPDNSVNDLGRARTFTMDGQSAEIMDWGNKNDLPNYREELVSNNAITPSLIRRKRDLVLGQDWFAYKTKYQDGKKIMDEVEMPPEAAQFFKKNKKLFSDVVGELMKHELGIVEYVRSKDGKIFSRKALETKYMRAGRKNDQGDIKTWWWSNAWTSEMTKTLKPAEKMLRSVPVLDEGNMIGNGRQDRFCVALGDWLFNDGYYPIPTYWGTRYWIELSNIIPLFHLANLKHMSAPRFIVVIPQDYFLDYEALNAATDEEGRQVVLSSAKAKKQAFLDDFNDLVTGVGNNGRTLTIESALEETLGKVEERRIKIEPLVIDLRDEALLKLYESSNVANISGQGLHPTLANIETQGRLSSGTEIRNAYLLWLIIAAPAYRNHMYQLVEIEKELGNWPADVYYAIKDAELTTLAENPAGVQPAKTTIGK